jgi:hypothetical protein
MTEATPIEPRRDPGSQRRELEERRLSDHAYAQRRAMLLMTALTFAITWGGIRLSSIDVFGLKVTAWNERYLLAFAAAVLGYLIGNFATLAQPIMVAWKADFDSFHATANRTMVHATAQIREGIVGIRAVLTEAGARPEAIDQFMAVADKFDSALDTRFPNYARRYLELHRARMRFEYLVPVGISLFVLYAVIPRLLEIG